MIEYMESTPYTDVMAPWNATPQVFSHICMECGGTGKIFHVRDIHTGDMTTCTETTYNLLPKTHEEAEARRQRWIRWGEEECEECDGEGWI